MAAEPDKKKARKTLEDEFIGNVTCPICLIVMMDDVYQCPAGHIYCNTCIAGAKHCHTCRIILPPVRIRALLFEQLREYANIKCENKDCKEITTGRMAYKEHEKLCKFNRCKNARCKYSGTKKDLEYHKFACKYRSMTCPLRLMDLHPTCEKVIKFGEVEKHLIDEHKVIFERLETKKNIKLADILELKDGIHSSYYILTNGDKIIVKVEKTNGIVAPPFKATARVIGVGNYKCKYEISTISPIKQLSMYQTNEIIPIDSDTINIENKNYLFEVFRPFEKFISRNLSNIATLVVCFEVIEIYVN